ncbi:crotonase/enoyl-CoA hydratase family protein [Frankia sp. R82]|uniref:crotonase/enoyl-CoA hydratase family protein n=1 Tax=Frankia sp. R82 TaxID=2950553 RepID=UPI0020434F56|nr:crotonase/enoyl-CoA hydratase family protein [Frankia sp. R82]MCM3885565.1 crotonase/enoyl-CoA hydratase family protein [Frankia sp. R82]
MAQVLVERDGAVMQLTLNRPRRLNAITSTMLATIVDACTEAAADDAIRCIVITGAEGNFSAGADLRAMAGDPDDEGAADLAQRRITDSRYVERGFLKIGRPPKPIIAAVEGVCIAGGTEILLGTDIRVAGRSARFGLSEARWSLYPNMGSPVRLPRQISYTRAAEILLTGRHLHAEEAERIGLIGRVVEDGEALAAAREIADQISANGPLAVEAILATIRESSGLTEDEGFARELERSRAVFASEDAKEGPRAFAEKRTPTFQRR